MLNPWMTITISQANNIDLNLRLIALTLLKQFEPKQYEGRVEIVEQPDEGRIVIKTSGKEHTDTVLDFLEKNNINWQSVPAYQEQKRLLNQVRKNLGNRPAYSPSEFFEELAGVWEKQESTA